MAGPKGPAIPLTEGERDMAIKIIFLDQDGTLLDSNKRFSDANRAALEKAAERGIHIVPCTGRFFQGITPAVRELPFVRYAVAVNGAQVYDREKDLVLHRCELLKEDAWKVYDVLEALPVIYDCVIGGQAYMGRSHYGQLEEFIGEPAIRKAIQTMRRPVEDFRDFVRSQDQDVQKISVFFKDMQVRERVWRDLAECFPNMTITSSIPNNLEINAKRATKGEGLRFLCRHLGLDVSESMAFGDGSNDRSMIEAAGIGVAMANAEQPLKELADYVTDTNDNDGVAKAIAHFCF